MNVRWFETDDTLIKNKFLIDKAMTED